MKSLKSLWQHRDLLKRMTEREIKARYKQSILGYFWIILNPLARLLVLSFVFTKIIKIETVGVPYPLFLYVGLLPWILFNNSVSFSMGSLTGGADLIKKIYFPREILPLAVMVAKVVDFFLASIVLLAFLILYGVKINLMALWFFPIFLIQFIFTTGLSLALSAFNLFYRDVKYLIDLLLILAMYLTPIIYPVEAVPLKYRLVLRLNPMAVIVNAYRQAILGQGMPNLNSLGVALIASFLFLVIGYKIFKKLEPLFADVA
jgi:lipopolysaccharide transport system permease protein